MTGLKPLIEAVYFGFVLNSEGVIPSYFLKIRLKVLICAYPTAKAMSAIELPLFDIRSFALDILYLCIKSNSEMPYSFLKTFEIYAAVRLK